MRIACYLAIQTKAKEKALLEFLRKDYYLNETLYFWRLVRPQMCA